MESGAEVESLQKTIYQGENHDISLMDRIPEKEKRAGKAAEPDFLGRAVGTTAREGAAAHLHALFSGHDAGADRRKTGDFAGAGVADGKEDFCGRCGWKTAEKLSFCVKEKNAARLPGCHL